MGALFLAPKKTCLTADEIVTQITLPKQAGSSVFCKVGKRNALAVSSINMAIAGAVAHGTVAEVRIAAGSCAPTPRRCPKTESALAGAKLTEETLSAAKELLLQEISPIDDRWATAEYRKLVAQNMLEDLLCQLNKEENA